MNNLDFMKSKRDCIDEDGVPKNRNQTEELSLTTIKNITSNSNSDSN